MDDRLIRLRATRILAVVRGPSPEAAIRAADALIAGGVSGIEITYSTPQAASVIETVREKHGQAVYLGAGTVTTEHQATEAAAAGAEFLVSPGTRPRLALTMKETGLVTMTGALTPSEVMIALEADVDVVKIFPASLGGPALLTALRGPFPQVRFMPTGGVTPANVGQWFAAGAVAVGAGSDLVSAGDLAHGDYDKVTEKAKQFAAAAAEFG